MIKTSSEIRDIVNKNEFLLWGISHGLFNLSKLTQYLKPLVETRTKKSLQDGAVLMSLSRLQRQYLNRTAKTPHFSIDNINVYSNLAILTFHNTSTIQSKITRDYRHIKEAGGFASITQGVHEITVIIDQALRAQFLTDEKPKKEYENVAAVSLKFSSHQSEAPGFLHLLLQLLTLQAINVIELSSTFTEITFYMTAREAKLAFDTFYTSLMQPKSPGA